MKLWVEETLGVHLYWWQRLWLLPTDRKLRRRYSAVLRIVDQINQCGDGTCAEGGDESVSENDDRG